MLLKWTLAIAGVVFAACGGGDDNPAVEKCDDLVSTVCDRAIECLGDLGGGHSQCVVEVNEALPCDRAASVTDSFQDCLSRVDTDSCNTLFPPPPPGGQRMLVLPANCSGVVVLERTQRVEASQSALTSVGAAASE